MGKAAAAATPTAQTNGERVRAAYQQWHVSRGHDPVPFIEMADDDIEMGSVLNPPELTKLAEGHHGLARMRDYFAALAAEWEMVEFPTEQVVEQGDTVVWIGRCTWRNKHTGVTVATPKVDIWTFRDGRAVKFFEMFDTLGFARGMGIMLAPPPARV
jgi:ketosteroid isomerase-like protein